eukprot:4850423-Ditylum_brightwellii.AAC.2
MGEPSFSFEQFRNSCEERRGGGLVDLCAQGTCWHKSTFEHGGECINWSISVRYFKAIYEG